jgi:hypothetical protein
MSFEAHVLIFWSIVVARTSLALMVDRIGQYIVVVSKLQRKVRIAGQLDLARVEDPRFCQQLSSQSLFLVPKVLPWSGH